MSNRPLFYLACAGALIGLGSAAYYGIEKKAQPPVFDPAPNPYARGVYANGIVQSDQENGSNIAIYPEVAGTVRSLPVTEGQHVKKGDVLLVLDDTVQRATTEQLHAAADAGRAALDALRAQPRPESLAVTAAQVDAAAASSRLAQDQLQKLEHLNEEGADLVSRDALDNVANAARVAEANLAVARRQFELAKAGPWRYDVETQAQQAAALDKAYLAARALLDRYTVRAPVDGTVLAIQTSVGSYVSAAGTYDMLSGSQQPVLLMGGGTGTSLNVRCYIDEILIHRLALSAATAARLFIRGTNVSIPLEFVRVQPYVGAKIELSNERAERVDLRVLTVIFRLDKPVDVQLYPGQLVDVYIDEGAAGATTGVAQPP